MYFDRCMEDYKYLKDAGEIIDLGMLNIPMDRAVKLISDGHIAELGEMVAVAIADLIYDRAETLRQEQDELDSPDDMYDDTGYDAIAESRRSESMTRKIIDSVFVGKDYDEA